MMQFFLFLGSKQDYPDIDALRAALEKQQADHVRCYSVELSHEWFASAVDMLDHARCHLLGQAFEAGATADSLFVFKQRRTED
jgi:hypothetical protein